MGELGDTWIELIPGTLFGVSELQTAGGSDGEEVLADSNPGGVPGGVLEGKAAEVPSLNSWDAK